MRQFEITLTTNNNSGPFDIYYTSEGTNVLAPLVGGGYATNIPASQLTTGVNILADYGVSNIYAINNKETCNSIQNLSQTPKINPYACVTYLVKNSSSETATISYIDCSGNTQTGTVPPFTTGNFTTSNGTPTCVSNCSGITSTPDPKNCKYYTISNPCSSVAVDVKYIDCSGSPQIVKLAPNQTLTIQAISNTIYGYSGNCGTKFTKTEIPDPYNPNPNSQCQEFIAINNCSLPAIISYTDCGGNISTLDIPAGSSVPYSSLAQGYTCHSGDCNCLAVYTPTQTCGFDFSILGSYTPEVPPAPIPTYKLSPSKLTMNEGETISVAVDTTDVNDGTSFYWDIYSFAPTSFTTDDFNALNGTVNISKNKGSFNIVAKNDLTTEEDQIFGVQLWTNSNRTQSLAESKLITLKDTSKTPPPIICGVRAYDTNIYKYNYTDNYVALPPWRPSYPTNFGVEAELAGTRHSYSFTTNNYSNYNIPMATTVLTPDTFPYTTDFPWVTSGSFTSSIFESIIVTTDKTFTEDQRGKYVYPLNNQILTWENNTYKNQNSSTYYTDAFISDVPTNSTPWIKGLYNGGGYAYVVPRTSTYALTGSVSFSFRGNDTGGSDQKGPSVFRIFGVIEKSYTPFSPYSWTKVAYTTMSQLPDNILFQNSYTKFAYNPQQSMIWFDSDMDEEVSFELKAQADVSISAGNYVRFTLYWQDINGVFIPRDYYNPYAYRGANYLNFKIGNPSTPSMFSIIDKTLR